MTLGLWSRWREQRHVIRGPRLFTAASGRCGVLQVQPWRPLLEPAQQQMLDHVEANRAQMQRLGDGALGIAGQCPISANLGITSELLVIQAQSAECPTWLHLRLADSTARPTRNSQERF